MQNKKEIITRDQDIIAFEDEYLSIQTYAMKKDGTIINSSVYDIQISDSSFTLVRDVFIMDYNPSTKKYE